ncbi:MAG: SGNH/GDSL hydrolase family protein [Thermodesulfovibrionales bacterium]|nr:SGNH/GDSL hydrolase family protein [Thermodesulfovibrionales bacterium]
MTKTKPFRILTYILVIAIVSLVLGELALRAYNKFRPVSTFSDDNLVRHRGKPHADVFGYKLNSKGFKDVEYAYEKPDNTYRIVAIGDSFVFSPVAYPDNFLTILEDKMGRTNTGQKIEIINMGINGLGPKDYHRLLNKEALAYGPDMVMVFFFVGNDIYLKLKKDMAPQKPKLYLFALVRRAAKVIRHLDVFQILFANEFSDTLTEKNRDRYMGIMLMNVEKYLLDQNGTPLLHSNQVLKEQYNGNLSYIAEMNRICRRNRSELVVVLVPEDMQVNNGLREFVISNTRGLKSEDSPGFTFDFTIPQKTLARDLGRLGIRYIDLYGYFRGMHEMSGNNYFIEYDGHWNIEGNRLAAESILLEMEKGVF